MGRSSLRMLASPYAELTHASLEQQFLTRTVERLWAKDHRLWKPDPSEISNRLGWLSLPQDMLQQLDTLRLLAKETRQDGITDVVLLGMGGSSLGPEVLRVTFGSQKGCPKLWVLDSTVPGWVKSVTKAIHPARTIFLVASKSGGTVEVMSLFAHFWDLVTRTKGNQGGGQFIAITDPATGLERMAKDYGFRQIFSNPPDIGGRYSVLSLFGLVPAALLGVNVQRLLERAARMADQCRVADHVERNPGIYLGVAMATMAKAGRDKVTIIASPPIDSFGLWAEQLLAESTGKEGTGLIPVAQEPVLTPTMYGQDRFFIYLRLKGAKNATLDRQVQALAQGGHPVLQFDLRDPYDLGAEFFRWEYATAVAGHLLGIQPFDQPNVQESKDNTNRVLEGFMANGRLPDQTVSSPKQAAVSLASRMKPGAYLSILAYGMPSKSFESAVRRLRKTLIQQHHITTTFGYGPRYLHSTGQLHKGGPNSGIFLELVDRMTPDLAIPGKAFSFGTLAQAQAAGDLDSLQAHERAVLRVSLGANPVAAVQAITQALIPARTVRRPALKRQQQRRR
ncbi:MAG: glucose-6-phosphate isomerase [Nitrospira sp.]|jgi:transaldolase/glucose-6-phosphate isomerase|nr:glucose-6-phosphate isomerase [Nitrospira sp.]